MNVVNSLLKQDPGLEFFNFLFFLRNYPQDMYD